MAGKKKKQEDFSWGTFIFVAICVCGILFGIWYVLFVMRRYTIDEIRISYLMPRSLTQKEWIYDNGDKTGMALFSDGKMSKPHAKDTPEWVYTPAYVAVDDGGELLRFHEDGYIRSVYSTDKTIEKLSGPDVLKGMLENAVLYELQYNLYDENEMEEFKAEYPDDDPSNEAEHNKRLHARRWVAYMGKQGVDRAYIVSMDADKYSKIEFLLFLKSVQSEAE